MARAPSEAISLPTNYPTTTIFVDESGSKSTASSFFVIAAMKLRKPGLRARQIKDVRDRYSFSDEFKVSQITKRAVPRYLEIIDLLEASDARLTACVVQGDVHNPSKGIRRRGAHMQPFSHNYWSARSTSVSSSQC